LVSQDDAPRQRASATAILLPAVILLALGLRFWRLGLWSLDSDEVFMLRDSISPDPRNPRPLLYFLNYFLVRPFLPLDEFGLRLLPAVFGVLAVPIFYVICRRLLGSRAALLGALLVAVSPILVYYSQFARYWSLVFLLCSVYPYAIYIGLRERNGAYLALGIVTCVLAVLAHPVSVLLVGGMGIWILATYLKREHLARLWNRSSVKWPVLLFVLLTGFAAIRSVTLLRGWITAHDTRQTTTEFLLSVPSKPGLKQVLYMAGFVDGLTLALVLSGALGIYLLWRERDRSLALFLTLVFLLPVVFLTLLSFRTPVSTFYLVPTIPVVFMGAGFFLDRLSRLQWNLRPAWLLPAALTLLILAEGAPTLLSQYRDGRRYDFRGAAQWLDENLTSDDVIFSDQFKVVTHYMPGRAVRRLRGDPAPLMQAAQVMHRSGSGQGVLWVVKPAASHAFRTNPRLGSLDHWLYGNCQLKITVGRSRLDYRQNFLQIYRCPPVAPEGTSLPNRASAGTKSGETDHSAPSR
jgi:4-amino-4-deoxy-L-arabinose transferase-like glycosyltransferase